MDEVIERTTRGKPVRPKVPPYEVPPERKCHACEWPKMHDHKRHGTDPFYCAEHFFAHRRAVAINNHTKNRDNT